MEGIGNLLLSYTKLFLVSSEIREICSPVQENRRFGRFPGVFRRMRERRRMVGERGRERDRERVSERGWERDRGRVGERRTMGDRGRVGERGRVSE